MFKHFVAGSQLIIATLVSYLKYLMASLVPQPIVCKAAVVRDNFSDVSWNECTCFTFVIFLGMGTK